MLCYEKRCKSSQIQYIQQFLFLQQNCTKIISYLPFDSYNSFTNILRVENLMTSICKPETTLYKIDNR